MANDNDNEFFDEDQGEIDWWGAPTVDFWGGKNQDSQEE